ncbi:MAG: hypothetical protein M1587_04850 [Thaumarchaeota archaeon]|nr:hypothetical protein [Nitrososphaerota archaeon]
MISLKHRTLMFLLGLALASTVSALYIFEKYTCHSTICAGSAANPPPEFSLYSISASTAVVVWVVFGFALFASWKGQFDRGAWKEAGFDRGVYELMVKMRGGNSRLELLRSLESPKQRNELSQVTGIDWKEVNRQVNLLLSYGLVSTLAESGSVKIYRLTEQGQLLLKLISQMNE